jgi:UvrB/uvrC motif
MSDRPQHLDDLLSDWPYQFGEVSARRVRGGDGREVVQLRVEMGVLQMEVAGRPDAARPEGFATALDWLTNLARRDGESFFLDERRCLEIDREFVQFFHRRVAWLALREFERAVADADHTLALMDFSSLYAPGREWAEAHEQYRPFVLFHRTQAAALGTLERENAEAALAEIDAGMRSIRQILLHDVEGFEPMEAEPADVESDELLAKLAEMKSAIAEHYELQPNLTQRLADAIAAEQYELAAELRDQLSRKPRREG